MPRVRRSLACLWLLTLSSACVSGTGPKPVAMPGAAKPSAAPVAPPREPLHALIIGGGPDKTHNQVAIESNVRYLGRLLPLTARYRVRFADGIAESATVQFSNGPRTVAYRAPDLPRLDGGADVAGVRAELDAAAVDARVNPKSDVLLYFTGHGSPDQRSMFANNWFDLWARGRFTVMDLSTALRSFPVETPVTLVMVQCYSGAFGNVLFANGDPKGALIDQHVAGFFAAIPTRLAAGCTPAINEAEYKDFTGYFFAALTGQDRMGRPVSGADYDRDGRIGMNEAFAWTLVHDDSIDTPVCTSDAFLNRFVAIPDTEIAGTTFSELSSWAGPAQRAALNGLADALRMNGDSTPQAVFGRYSRLRPNSMAPDDVRVIRFVNLARTIARAHALKTTGDDAIKRRYAQLLADESRNPLK